MITGIGLLVVFTISIAVLLLLIIKFKLNPFIALLMTAILTGFLVRMPVDEVSSTISKGFGNTLAGIGIVIGLGIIFGNILAESRATEAIARGLLKRTGDNKAALAVTVAGFLISIPVFMDAAFVIMMPIVKYVAKATKKSLLVFVTALGVGTIVGHAVVIPTPGPLAVAANVNANVGYFILYSLIVAIPAVLVAGWLYGKSFNALPAYQFDEKDEKAYEEAQKNVHELPSFGLSMGTLLLPILLILVANIILTAVSPEAPIVPFVKFIGDKNIALLIGILVAFMALRKYLKKTLSNIVLESADSAGLILLITGAGGAFGSVINGSGIGAYLVDSMSTLNVPIILLGFVLSGVLRVSQGSTTVAIVTTSSILGAAIAGTGVSPILVGLAICAGGVGLSLPNDSGFWVLSRFSGISVNDTLKTWTAGGTIAGLVVFAMVMLLSALNSLVGLPGL
ncbi:GntP family permease [Anaerotalea alkaliphila]|uniref:GntP family permease n=1 Tax=Anaerotalea alkaliphila TaxID=2662126 RepID=A0A7X5HVL7_9FIRM|nr:gluconate:H+ symporter [Anaerotalea alkaliphila]NDL67256.1 GntP family permease [Anaerotalea alkaliphila]